VAAPSVPEIVDALQIVSDYEGLQLPGPFAQKIAEESQGNMRKALLMLEAAKVQK
jgi:replication factor C subunit 3/5